MATNEDYASVTIPRDAVQSDRIRKFMDFLDDEAVATNYRDLIRLMLAREERRLIVSLEELYTFDREFWDGILNNPSEYLPAVDSALKEVVMAVVDRTRHTVEDGDVFYVAFRGSFGDHAVSPRTIAAEHVGKLVSLEGIVTRCSLVRPKVVRSVHYCEKTNNFHAREYLDQAMATSLPFIGSVYPTEDADGNPLTTEYGYSTYRDHQTMAIQEMPERAPAGQLPRSVEVVLDDDLVDAVKPGDRIQLVGMYKSMGSRSAGKDSGSAQFRTVILANNIVLLSTKANGGLARARVSDIDIRNINRVAKKRNVFELLSQSLAPSIYGHDYIKKAILLMLLSGMEKNLENGTHIRGDINILMVGDPSTAKSQLLRFVLNTAPLAIATTGRGSSGVGLTAAVTSDRETGERRLEAGAMVLADRGVVCIDEFDKMSDVDRVAIHEVMEQQTVTIAKAGIHTSLNARCSVIAAANPVFGQYDTHKDPHRNIALPDSLLSRFDLLFVVTDEINDARDRAISEHVLRMHRYMKPGSEEGVPVREDVGPSLQVGDSAARRGGADSEDDEDIEARGGVGDDADEHRVYEKYDSLLHAGVTTKTKVNGTRKVEVLSIPFVKKYVHYAKSRIRPVLSKHAAEYIVNAYTSLRNDDLSANQRKTSPITARTLETLIRLATAHAKARLSARIETKDAKVAEEILRFALFKEVVKAKRGGKRRRLDRDAVSGSESEEDEEDDVDDEDDSATYRPGPNASSRATSSSLPPMTTRQRTTVGPAGHTSQTIYSMNGDDNDLYEGDTQDGNFRVLAAAVEAMDVADAEATAAGVGSSTGGPMAAQQPGTGISPSRLQIFSRIVGQLLNTELFSEDFAKVSAVTAEVNRRMQQEDVFSDAEALAALNKMNDRNQIMLSSDVVYKI
ncbi:MCM2/3/5 family-domain-containing protein [Limtongia smithiae]|uniref:MCM2/3/5 family-domain-containing protein n=1 Tax=Limtongia smithiae TaxID=1125753 RepID=UPI0034CFB8FA